MPSRRTFVLSNLIRKVTLLSEAEAVGLFVIGLTRIICGIAILIILIR